MSSNFFTQAAFFWYTERVRSRRKFSPKWGEWLRENRLRVGDSQVERAGRLGISPSYLSQMEHGIVPEKAVVERLATTLGDDPAEWLAAAGYAQADAVAEDSAPYGSAPRTDKLTDVVELVVRIDRRTGKVLSSQQVWPTAPKERLAGGKKRT